MVKGEATRGAEKPEDGKTGPVETLGLRACSFVSRAPLPGGDGSRAGLSVEAIVKVKIREYRNTKRWWDVCCAFEEKKKTVLWAADHQN